MSIWRGGVQYGMNLDVDAESSSNLEVARDLESFIDGQTILDWVCRLSTSTEKSISEITPTDAPTSDFKGVLSAKLLEPEKRVREVIAYSASTDDVYYRIAVLSTQNSWLIPWRNIAKEADKLNGLMANQIFNVDKTLSGYIGNLVSPVDIRALIGSKKIPSGQYTINTADEWVNNVTGIPFQSGILNVSILSVNLNGVYNATVFASSQDNSPTSYICTIYNGTQYTGWLSITGAAEEGVDGNGDILGYAGRTEVPASANLNNYKSSGAFYITSDAVMLTVINRPSTCVTAAYLNVRPINSNLLVQELIDSNFRIWSRNYKSNTDEWSPWVYVYNSSDNLKADANNGVHIGEYPPDLATKLWCDTGHDGVLKYYNKNTLEWTPCATAWG